MPDKEIKTPYDPELGDNYTNGVLNLRPSEWRRDVRKGYLEGYAAGQKDKLDEIMVERQAKP